MAKSSKSAKKILVVPSENTFAHSITAILQDQYDTLFLPTMQSAVDNIFNSLPDLLIVKIDGADSQALAALNNLKDDPLFRQIPVLAIFPEQFPVPDWNLLFVEDYVRESDLKRELLERVQLTILRSERIVEINPLTRLPGNISINRQIQGRLGKGEEFALGYTDIDYFKPFNDKYGFLRGDEIIKITGRLVMNITKNKQPQGSFVGHIGGDDFIFLMAPDLVVGAVDTIVETFDSIIPTLYDADDRQRGYIRTLNRQGKETNFPLISISIGITDTVSRKFRHFGEVTEAAAEMKNYAKRFKTSCYRWDKRHDRDKR